MLQFSMRLQGIRGKRLVQLLYEEIETNKAKLALILSTACSSFFTSRATMVMSAPF